MLGFISFSFEEAREQEMLNAQRVARYLLDYGKAGLASCADTEYAGLLASHNLHFTGEPYRLVGSDDRTLSEIERIMRDFSGTSSLADEWTVVVRPGKGLVSHGRLQRFCMALRDLDMDDGHDVDCVMSATRFTTLNHPMWNLRSTEKRFHEYGMVRIPRKEKYRKDSVEFSCPELWDRFGGQQVGRSQDLEELFHCDYGLYAFRALTEEPPATLPNLARTICDTEGDKDRLPFLLQLPLYAISCNQVVDYSSLEQLLKNSPIHF